MMTGTFSKSNHAENAIKDFAAETSELRNANLGVRIREPKMDGRGCCCLFLNPHSAIRHRQSEAPHSAILNISTERMSHETTAIDYAEAEAGVGNLARSVEVRVPASTSNLGAGFDCYGLALRLYLTVRATVVPRSAVPCRVRSYGNSGSGLLPRSADNLIFRTICFVAERQGWQLPPIRLAVHSEIPLASGLGSSGAAIIAGAIIAGALGEAAIPHEAILRYATELEGHADNVAAALYGGWVAHCITKSGEVLAVKRRWPEEIKVIVVTPHFLLETKKARQVLPQTVSRADAVHNMQRIALFSSALEARADDLLWEAMQDRLHQAYREPLVPGLAEALAVPRREGLLGLALSGAGPSVLALASSDFDEIGGVIANCFHQHGLETTVRLLEIDDQGATSRDRSNASR